MRDITPESVREACLNLGFALAPTVSEGLAAYLSLLVKWNRVMNLVGPADWRSILDTLIVDSLHLADFLAGLPLPERLVAQDLGAGAGLPGVPLRMIWNKGSYTLVESREKRALFLRACLASVPLSGVSVFHGRAETFLAGREDVGLTVSRAFMPWEKVLDLVAPRTTQDGLCVFLALKPAPDPLPEGWRLAAQAGYRAGGEDRCFWALRRSEGKTD